VLGSQKGLVGRLEGPNQKDCSSTGGSARSYQEIFVGLAAQQFWLLPIRTVCLCIAAHGANVLNCRI
jgi:hypothetical protein